VGALVEAMMTVSDNTATNLLLASIGGPAGLTRFLRSPLGDAVTRSDRYEPAMSEGQPGDERDTTSPAAFLASMRALTLGDALSPPSRERLILLMKANQTSARLLRARIPLGWQIGDRTGAAGHRTVNIVGLIWPLQRPDPVLFSVFLTEGPATRPARDAVLVEVGAAITGRSARRAIEAPGLSSAPAPGSRAHPPGTTTPAPPACSSHPPPRCKAPRRARPASSPPGHTPPTPPPARSRWSRTR
jgi:beta-lactamase class A